MNIRGVSLMWLLVFLAPLSSECALPADALLAWWPGEGSGTNRTRNPSLSWIGTADYGPGIVGEAFRFNGENQLIVPDAPWMNTSAFTFEAWVHPNGYDGEVDVFVCKEENPFLSGIRFELGIKGNKFATDSTRNPVPTGNLVFYLGGILGLPNNYSFWVDGRASVPTNQWSHVALSFSRGVASVHLNGAATAVYTGLSGELSWNPGPLRIGSRSQAVLDRYPQDGFNGLVDEPGFFSRALTTSEINTIYLAGASGKYGTNVIMRAISTMGLADPERPGRKILPASRVGDQIRVDYEISNQAQVDFPSSEIQLVFPAGILSIANLISKDITRITNQLNQTVAVLPEFKIGQTRMFSVELMVTNLPSGCCVTIQPEIRIAGEDQPIFGESVSVAIARTSELVTDFNVLIQPMKDRSVVVSWQAQPGVLYQAQWGRFRNSSLEWIDSGDPEPISSVVMQRRMSFPQLFPGEVSFVRIGGIRVR